MHNTNYYRSTLSQSVTYPSLAGGKETDVCIVGGGYAGLMTQLGLLQRGVKDVLLLEADSIAYGASGRNGGFVFGGYSLPPKALVNQVGTKHAMQLYQLSLDAVDLIRQRVRDFSVACELVDEGVILANWFKSQTLLRDEQSFMQQHFNVHWEYLDPKALREKVNSPRYSGGLLETNAMHFNPLKYALGIAEQNIALGGEIFEHSRALSVQSVDQGVEVKTSVGCIKCKHLVICAGGYIGNFYPKVAKAILPIATYIMVTENLGRHYANTLRSRAAVYDTRFAFDYYRPLTDGRLLWGGRISANTKTPNDLAARLRQDMRKVFPQLAEAKTDYVWSGLMGYPRHQMPIIGQLEDRVWSNIGFGGHGVGPTTVGGEVIASAIAEGDERYKLFSPWGPQWAGGGIGALAAQTSYWWYQARDCLRDVLGR